VRRGLLFSVLVHVVLIAAFVALLRTEVPPALFVDLAHGLDLAEEKVSDLRRAVADVRARVMPRAAPPRARSEGEPRPAASAPVPPAPAPAETRRVDPPAPPAAPEPVRPAPEPSPPVANPPPAPEPRTVELPPTPSSTGDGAAPLTAPTRAAAPASGGDGRAAAGSAVPGGSASVSDGGGQPGAGVRSGSRDGPSLALAIPGTRGGDPAAAEYSGYYDTLRRRLHESLTYPQLARRRGLTGTVTVDVEVDSSGKVGRVTLVNSSSHGVLDAAAIDAMRSVGRVPFPPGVTARRLVVRMPVVFEMR
jgi:TonB family protein